MPCFQAMLKCAKTSISTIKNVSRDQIVKVIAESHTTGQNPVLMAFRQGMARTQMALRIEFTAPICVEIPCNL
jgi:hypothetical protein